MAKMIALSFLLSLSFCLLWIGAEGQTSGQLRLVARDGRTSSSLTAGRLEVYYSGQWGTVCDDNFGQTEARVACNQLGFTRGYLNYTNVGSSSSSSSRFTAASSRTRTWLDSLNCFGSESRLIDCASSIGFEDCTHSEDVALYCLGNGALRLSSSFSASAGRIDIYYNGVWGTVCDDFFGQTDADVACRQLGFASASRYGRVAILGYSQGTGTIWLDDLACTSSDLMLSTCSHSGFGNENCGHSEDVAVSCSIFSTGPTSGQLRLVNRNGQTSSTLTAGRLEVYYNGQWGTVCDDNFGPSEARVACNQLGFIRGYLYYTNVGSSTSSSRFSAASSITRTWFDSLSCSSSDTRLIDCASSIGIEDCTHSQDVVLYCLGNGALRLSSSVSASAGRIDIYYNGVWGTVCDDSFGSTDADVACRQLGFASASRYGNVGSLGYSRGTGTIWLDDLACTSYDLMLATCSHNGFGNENCGHSEDVAVICSTFSTAQTSGQLRLVNRNGQTSSNLTAGRLEVYYSGQWGTVCDDNFGASEARVACRQLGFTDGYLHYTTVGTRFTAASSFTRTWLDSLSCSGSESRLIDCASSFTIGIEDCTHSEDIALFCLGDGALRLSLSILSSSGRVEVYYNGVWGTVCDDSFGQTDANVACQQLGYSSASRYGTVGSLGYSRGTGTIWLDNLGCTSSDLMLSTCSHNGFGNENCVHSEDVAVSCSTSTYFSSGLSSAAIAGIAIAVVVPLCCIGICVTVVVIAVCTGACATGATSSRNHGQTVSTAITPPTTATVVTSTEAKIDHLGGNIDANAPPPYPGTAYPAQPQVAPAPYPQTGYAYSVGLQPAGHYSAEQQQQLAYPVAGQLELQQYPAQPGYPAEQLQPPGYQYPADPAQYPYPATGNPPPTNQ